MGPGWRQISPEPPGVGGRAVVVHGLALRCYARPRRPDGGLTVPLAVLGEPRAGMLQKTHESQADQKLGRAAAWSLAKPRGDLLERVRALTAAPGRHERLKSGAVSGERWIQPGIIRCPHRDDGPHLGVWLA
jgi:hypothetical protein